MKKLLASTVICLSMASAANAHSIGIADVVSGTSASIWMSTYHFNAGLEGGITLTGPGQGVGGMEYAFDTDHNLGSGATFSGFTGYDAGPFYTSAIQDWQSVTVSGLANGNYNYVFTSIVGGGITIDYAPHLSDYSKYNGSFTITDAVAPVPLPAGGMLLLTAMGALAFRGRRKS